MTLRSLVLTSIASLAACAGAHATTFDLASHVGATPTFNVTSNGVTATYSADPGNGYAVQDTTGLFSFNTALVDPYAYSSERLTISFSTAVSGTILIPFGFLDSYGVFGPDTLTVTANTGQTAGFLGALDSLALHEPEGVGSFLVTSPVTSITLTGTNPFGIGNVSTVTPEPASLVLLATGLVGIVVRRRA